MSEVYDQMRTIVERITAESGLTCYYQFGHPLEIVENLKAMSADPAQAAGKYPLVALFADYTQKKGNIGYAEVTLHLIIATLTDVNYTASDRAANTFKPILYPIYDALMEQIARSGYYMGAQPGKITHNKTDRFFFGRNGLYDEDGNVFNDAIDVIDVENLELKVHTQNNC